MKKIIKLVLSLVILLGLSACSSNNENDSDIKDVDTSELVVAYSDYLNSDNPSVEIIFEDLGSITLQLFPSVAPYTVDNFLNLAENDFYDGLTMHRVIEGFMIQGGDPSGDGTGGSDKNVVGEFNSNGIENNLSHTRGVISMARSQEPNSASSQFFIVHNDSSFLDGDYAAFGGVTSGFDVLDTIATTETGSNDLPVKKVVIKEINVNRNGFEISNDSFLNKNNPTATITYSNDLKIKLELLPNIAKSQVDNFIKLVEDEAYIDKNSELTYQENIGLFTTSTEEKDFFIESSDNKAYTIPKSVVMYNQGLANTESSTFIILETSLTPVYSVFAVVVDGYEEYLDTKFDENTTITNIELDLKDYKANEPSRISSVFLPAESFLSADNPNAVIELSNGDTFKIQLLKNAAPITVNYFMENTDKFIGQSIMQLLVDELAVTSGTSEPIDKLVAETVLNHYPNNVNFDKYTLAMYFPDFENTFGQIIFALNELKTYNMAYPVFAYVIENKEVIDKINNLNTTDENGMIEEKITIKSINIE